MENNNNKVVGFDIKPQQFAHKEQVYVCAPFSVKTREKTLKTLYEGGEYVEYVKKKMQYFAIAVHTYLPAFINDKILFNRDEMKKLRRQILEQCDIVMVCGAKISREMKQDILYAIERRKKIVVFRRELFQIVMKLMETSAVHEFDLRYDENHPTLAKSVKLENGNSVMKRYCG